MNLFETAKVLAVASGYDQRRVDEVMTTAWAHALDGIGHAEAERAVIEHYRLSSEFCKPSHVIALVKSERRALSQQQGITDGRSSSSVPSTHRHRWLPDGTCFGGHGCTQLRGET